MWCIVPDEHRGKGQKAARRCAVALGSPLEGVAALVRGNRPVLRATPAQQASQSDHNVST